MVQTYGVAPESSAEPNALETDEGRALLGGPRRTSKVDSNADGHASLISCISNLSNTIIGSGMLTFPLAMASAGIIPGMITCIFSGSVAAFGLYLLSLCAAKTKHRHASFHAVSQLTFPKAAVFFDAAIATKCFGVSISYLIIIKGLMPNVVASLYHDLTSPDTNPPEWALNGSNWITFFILILGPLCFLRQLNSLRHTSYIALFSVAYLVVIVITCHIWPLKGMPEPGEIRLIHFTPNFVSTFPVQVFAFTCAQNLFPIYNELKSNTQPRMNIVIGGSIGSATLTYEVIAIFGYLTFGSKVGANIIAMYPSTSLFIAIGQLAIVILVLFSYPLQVHPCRNCLDKIFHSKPVATPKTVTAGQEVEEEEAEEEDEDHGHAEMSKIKHFVLTAAIIASGFTVAYLVDDLRMVLSFVGATGSTTISFILPGLFFWKLTRNDPSVPRSLNLGAFGLMVYGICVFVFCLSFNIYQLVHGEGPVH
ncbi:transmembrane amino acid transporter protein-domain-containing protein [Crassisporium funariophilum]|nr:transmembrane amino acid transporter protein-domain-containing protein [Crassisporium funariophilum]